MRSKITRILVSAAAAASFCVQPAHATPGTGPAIIAGADAKSVGYATPVMAVRKGDPLTFINLDIEAHNVLSVAVGPDTQPWCDAFAVGHCPLFFSAVVGVSATPAINGLENAVPGTIYDFWCVVHPGSAQTGKLVVLPEA